MLLIRDAAQAGDPANVEEHTEKFGESRSAANGSDWPSFEQHQFEIRPRPVGQVSQVHLGDADLGDLRGAIDTTTD